MFLRFGGWAACACMVACPFELAAEPASREGLRRVLYFSGIDISSVSMFSWAGADIALKSRDRSGPILRLAGGVGGYDYASEYASSGRIHGDVTLGEIVAGWRHFRPGLAITALAGAEIEDHRLDAEDPDNNVSGTGVGARLIGELWWEPSANRRLEASVAYGTAFDFYRARIAGGLHIWRGVFAGPEVEVFGNAGSDQRRAGIYIQNVTIKGLHFKTSIGALDDGDEIGAFGRLGVDAKF
jgi:hypothetical protein